MSLLRPRRQPAMLEYHTSRFVQTECQVSYKKETSELVAGKNTLFVFDMQHVAPNFPLAFVYEQDQETTLRNCPLSHAKVQRDFASGHGSERGGRGSAK